MPSAISTSAGSVRCGSGRTPPAAAVAAGAPVKMAPPPPAAAPANAPGLGVPCPGGAGQGATPGLHLDPRREVVVVLLTGEVGHFLGDVGTCVPVLPRDLTQKVKASLRPEGRAEGRFARDDDVRRAGSQLRRGPDLRREAQLSHRWRV